MDRRQPRSALEVYGERRHRLRQSPLQGKEAPYISSGPHSVPAEEGVGPLDFVFFAECLHNGAAQNLRPHRLENSIPHTDMAPKASQ